MAHKPAGSTLHNRCTPREPVRASDQAADLSSDQVRQHLAVGRQVGHDLLETTVLILELLDTLHLGRQQTGSKRQGNPVGAAAWLIWDRCLALV